MTAPAKHRQQERNTATTTDTAKPEWLDALPVLDLDGIRPVFDELAGNENDAARAWIGDRRHIGRTDRRVLLDARRLAKAVEHIGRLPEAGEAFHLVTRGAYSLWHVVKAALQLGAPATIAYLGVATLGFSRSNLEELLAVLDNATIGKVDFLYSVYFKSNEREICQRLAHELATRGHRVVACLQHAKVVLIEMTDGRTFAVESSANLRSCASIENITIHHDRALFDFHRTWIDEMLSEGKANEKTPHDTTRSGPDLP